MNIMVNKKSGRDVIVRKLKARMQFMNMNPRTLAARSNVGRSFVYDILNGKSKNPTSAKLSAICKELRVPLSYLMNHEDGDVDYEEYVHIKPIFDQSDRPQVILHKLFFKPYDSDNEDFCFYKMPDDSMEASISCSNIMILQKEKDTDNKIYSGIYMVQDHINTVIRRVEPVIGEDKINVIADNHKYNRYVVERKNLKIIAKVLFCIKKI
ncbi:MAG: helix-turn-helix family protein [Candidatus Xenolissoclinum pacificiensis L6]|uniref:Helix-turn-helix family protein n=1 Tax=Candidatus Xenolissoclinum pacificiensis L6 TaxID=1401685 RepID=W2UZ73_9RICK|nr:MAG: helix-turn-helix family protein [Candidatus Xenolissoclinum pacificiensis L6]